jgi:uncharacterized RDD family membrane protein YckC
MGFRQLDAGRILRSSGADDADEGGVWMTDPAGGAPTPQGSGDWQTPPPPAAAPGGFQAAPVAAGPAPGVMYADLVTRIIAYVIDAILLSIAFGIVGVAILGGFLLTGGLAGAIIGFVVLGLLYLVGSAAYFIYTWTTMRATPGQKILSLETVNAADGATLTRDQAIKRWAYLFGPSALGTVANFALVGQVAILGSLISLATFIYTIYLLYTASQSPKRQGFHDVQSGTVVVKRVA